MLVHTISKETVCAVLIKYSFSGRYGGNIAEQLQLPRYIRQVQEPMSQTGFLIFPQVDLIRKLS